jgi:hypothetical protein
MIEAAINALLMLRNNRLEKPGTDEVMAMLSFEMGWFSQAMAQAQAQTSSRKAEKNA